MHSVQTDPYHEKKSLILIDLENSSNCFLRECTEIGNGEGLKFKPNDSK